MTKADTLRLSLASIFTRDLAVLVASGMDEECRAVVATVIDAQRAGDLPAVIARLRNEVVR